MRRLKLLFLIVFILSGCTESATQLAAPESEAPEPEPSPEPQPEPEPVFVAPLIWGTEALADENDDPDVVEVTLEAAETVVTFFDEIEAQMMAYSGVMPGPLIQAKVGDEIVVHFNNNLAEPTTVHWHGLRLPEEMDGSPRIQSPVEPGESFTYRFVAQDAGSFWYHPHVRANEQVEKGLYGMLVVHDPAEPAVDKERYVALDDILLTDIGLPGFLTSHMEVMHGRTGNVLLANGSPDLLEDQAEQGQVERWRLVNTANARTMEISVRGASVRVIASDGGLVTQPYEKDRIQLAVGQRYDLEVLYDEPGQVELLSHVLTINDANEIEEIETPLMAVTVEATEERPAPLEWPQSLTSLRPIDREVELVFDAEQTFAGLRWTLNGRISARDPLFTFNQGETVKIKLRNMQGPEHPFHLHGQFFRIINDGRPETSQPGLKDTVLVPGRSSVTIIAYMDNPGRWMAHCHILEHAELGMMSEFLILPASN